MHHVKVVLASDQKNGDSMKVWIDQDLCTGDGLCEEIAPEAFWGQDDGLFYVKGSRSFNFGAEKLFDGSANPAGAEGWPASLMARSNR